MTAPLDIELLLDEISRYLAAIDVFRREGCEPTWRPVAAERRSKPFPRKRRIATMEA
jgi:hypothetical protein